MILDAKDPYTAGHSQRVSDMATKLCQLIGMKDKDIEKIHIPAGARIIAICDSIDAITSNRCYRKAHDFEYCYNEIEKNLGKMYDPIMGKYVLDNFDEITKVVR